MRLRDEPPISASTMAYAGRSGMNLPQARSVEESANRVRQYFSGGQVERRGGLLPPPGPIAPTPQPAPAPATPYSPPATSMAMPSRLDPGFLHSVAMGASAHLSTQQFGASW